MPDPATSAQSWPGHRLGLPESGPRSVARLGRRVAALAIDWAMAVVVSVAFFSYDSLATLAVFAVAQVLGQLTIGGSAGHRLVALRLVRVDGRALGVLRPVLRTLLLCLVIPAVIWDRDQRGLHDRAAGTVLVRG